MEFFIRPLAENARILVEREGKPVQHYAVMLQLRAEGVWQTIHLLDNAHGQHDLHRYTGREKQPAERFADGSVRQVMPKAIGYLISNWKGIARSWET